jgi:hypothetical protein
MTKEDFEEITLFYNSEIKHNRLFSIEFIAENLNHTAISHGLNDDMTENVQKPLKCMRISHNTVFLQCIRGAWSYNYKDLIISKKSLDILNSFSKNEKTEKTKFDVKDLSNFMDSKK